MIDCSERNLDHEALAESMGLRMPLEHLRGATRHRIADRLEYEGPQDEQLQSVRRTLLQKAAYAGWSGLE